jgi:crotonobetainyl-CoA:carnitine CoA-transferase CaiB-like acyl-CoA transferase
MLSQLNYLAGAWLNAQEKPVRQSLSAHPYIVPAQVFASADGWLTLFITHDNFWNKFCEIINKSEWITDERFCTMKKRGEHRVSLIPLLNEVMKTKTSNEWEALLIPLGIVVAGIKNLSEAISSSLTKDREMVIKLRDSGTNFLAIGNPIKNIGYKTTYNIAPKLNQDPNAQFES